MKILFLQKLGCDFWSDEPVATLSDIGNYRVGTLSECVKGKDGNNYFLEFSLWRRYAYRNVNKITGRMLKRPVKELVNQCGLCINVQYTNANGTFGNHRIEKEISDLNMSYTTDEILTVVNLISSDTYNQIVFIDNDILNKASLLAENREIEILQTLESITLIQQDNAHEIYRFMNCDGNKFFDYDKRNNQITG